MSTTEKPSLSDELANLEAELADLNDRRVDLYRRSLQAAQHEKACGDLVSNAMLTGPLGKQNKIEWPVQLNGIGWVPDGPPVYSRRDPSAWVRIQVIGTSELHLGLHLGDVATAVQAHIGQQDKMLHLSYQGHNPAVYVPALNKIVMGFAAMWAPLGDERAPGPQISELHGALEKDSSLCLWFAAAHRDLLAKEVDQLEAGEVH
jgi:hypothetical protein